VLAICRRDVKSVTKALGQLTEPAPEPAPPARPERKINRADLADYKAGIDGYMELLALRRADWQNYPRDRWTLDDPYTYDEYYQEVTQFVGVDQDELIAFIAWRFNRVIAIILPDEVIVKKNLDTDRFHVCKKLPDLACHYKTRKKNKIIMVKVTQKEILEKLSLYGFLTVYRGKVMDPSRQNDPRKFNLWQGFVAEDEKIRTATAPEGVVVEICEFIRDWICGGDEESYKAFMKCLVETARNPGKKIPWCIWLYSHEKRLGKTVFCEFIQKYVFGRAAVKKMNGMSELLEKHNAWIIGKKMVILEECSASKEDFKVNWDKMKSLIGDLTVNVNAKFINQADYENYVLVMIITNHRASLFLEADDRRYLCLEVSNPPSCVDKQGYLKALSTKMLRADSGKLFFEFISETKDFDSVDPYHTDPPVTSLKEQLIEDSLLPEARFVGELGVLRLKYLSTKGFEKTRKFLEEGKYVDFGRYFIDPDGPENSPIVEYKYLEKKMEDREIEKRDFYISGYRTFASMLAIIGEIQEGDINATESSLIKRINAIVEESNYQSADTLYALFVDWFRVRLTDDVKYGIVGRPAGVVQKNAFCKRISQCMNQSRRKGKLNRRVSTYDLDTVKDMYLRLPHLDRLRSALVEYNIM
jgi:hypothetical protein